MPATKGCVPPVPGGGHKSQAGAVLVAAVAAAAAGADAAELVVEVAPVAESPGPPDRGEVKPSEPEPVPETAAEPVAVVADVAVVVPVVVEAPVVAGRAAPPFRVAAAAPATAEPVAAVCADAGRCTPVQTAIRHAAPMVARHRKPAKAPRVPDFAVVITPPRPAMVPVQPVWARPWRSNTSLKSATAARGPAR